MVVTLNRAASIRPVLRGRLGVISTGAAVLRLGLASSQGVTGQVTP